MSEIGRGFHGVGFVPLEIKKKPEAEFSLRLSWSDRLLAGEQNCVDHLDYAVGLIYVGDC
jgi:hypothetical protein